MAPDQKQRAYGVLVVGLVVLALGVVVAVRFLPEWQAQPPLNPALLVEARADVAAAGGRLLQGRLTYDEPSGGGSPYERAYRMLGDRGTAYLVRSGGAVSRFVRGSVELPELGVGQIELSYDPAGRLRTVQWWPGDTLFGLKEMSEQGRRVREAFLEALERRLTAGRAPSGPELSYFSTNTPVRVRPLEARPGEPRESLLRIEPPNKAMLVMSLSDPAAPQMKAATRVVRQLLLEGAPFALLALTVLVLFAVLLARRRLGPRIGFLLGGLALFSMLVGGLGRETEVVGLILRIVQLLYLVVLWMVAESLLRDTVPGFTTSLDALAAGRLGPRAGRALLAGLGCGAAVAGLRLVAAAAASRLASTGFRPEASTLSLPLFSGTESPFYEGTYTTAVFVLFVALFRFRVQRRWAEPAAAVLFALLTSISVPLQPWGGAFAGALATSIVLLQGFHRFGFASLLVAATSAALFRDAAAGVRFVGESPFPLLVGGLSLGAILVTGAVGLHRPARDDEGRIEAPEYMRRLESERRVKYEMDLLSRMQLALLPERPPRVDGLDIAVRTVLATEAGGDLYDFAVDASGALWVAAGDVSGHGYSCGIQQAMVKACFASLAGAGRSPAEILGEIDRVLRTAGKSRLFTSLALLRVDPRTGEAQLASAGHPFPLLLAEGRCREIAAPAFPLGQGPPRRYEDVAVTLPEGAVLVIASDGLYEGPDRFDAPYGYERPQAVLTSVGLFRRPSEAIVEALFADWRLHVGEGAPADDTTVLVLKRPALFS